MVKMAIHFGNPVVRRVISEVASLFLNLIHPEELQAPDNEWRMQKNYPRNDIKHD